jgi:hypothetical protein
VRKHGGFFYACSPDARYERMMVRPRHVRRASCATIHIAPCAQGARYDRMMVSPRPVRRASCATTHIAPCAECARYDRALYVAHLARQYISPRASKAHATTAPRTSRIVRDHPYRPVRPRRTLRPHRVRRALCATIHIAPCAECARYQRATYVAHCARQSISRRAPKAHATTAPCTSRILRDNTYRPVRPRRTLPPHRVRRASCATTHIAPCAECARYARTAYVAHCARQSTPRRAQNAHATTA